MTPRQRKFLDLLIDGWAMHSLPNFLHGDFPQILKKAGFTDVKVENITPRMLPMVRKLSQIGFLFYQVFKLFGLRRKFINITFAVEGDQIISKSDIWRYNIITATKPS